MRVAILRGKSQYEIRHDVNEAMLRSLQRAGIVSAIFALDGGDAMAQAQRMLSEFGPTITLSVNNVNLEVEGGAPLFAATPIKNIAILLDHPIWHERRKQPVPDWCMCLPISFLMVNIQAHTQQVLQPLVGSIVP